jgi:hypothetical protein
MHEDRMTQELIGELYQRYMRGELTLDAAAEQIFALMHAEHDEPSGLAVVLSALDTADQERTLALFDRVAKHTVREVLLGADIPPLAGNQAEPNDSESGNGIK